MATRYAVGSGLWSDTATVWSDSDGGAAGSYVPVDGDTVVISAGVAVQVDVDQSAWTGLVGMTVRGHATSPGMVYWKNGTSGTLKFRTGADVVGTDLTTFGRILANSDGVWATNTALAYATKATILLAGTAKLDCTYLSVKMIPTEPALTSIRIYKDKVDVDQSTAISAANDTVDVGAGSIGLFSAGLAVKVVSTDTLPGGLSADNVYYVRGISGNTLKLALYNSDATIVDITSTGTGTLSLLTGHTNTSTDTVNVLDDISADNWTNGDAVVLVDAEAPEIYDQQRLTITAKAAGTMQLSANVDSAQYPCARIWLSSRNCSIRNTSTAATGQVIVNAGANCTFGEIRCETGTGTTFYGYGINAGTGHSVSCVSGCYSGAYGGTGHTVLSIAGCDYGINYGTGNTVTNISGCNYGINYGVGNTVTNISGCNNGIYGGTGNTVTNISGCNYGINFGGSSTVTYIIGCQYGLWRSSNNKVANMSGNAYDIGKYNGINYASGGIIPTTPSNSALNSDGDISRFCSEDHAGVYGAQVIFQSFGNATKVTAGSGTPTPEKRPGGNDYLIELSNLQTNLSGTGGSGAADNYVIAWEPYKMRLWATESVAKTYRFYVQSTFDLPLATDLVLRATYHDSASDTGWATVASDETVTTRSGLDDWSQYVEVSVTPARTGWVKFELELRAYSSGGRVYVDPLVAVS